MFNLVDVGWFLRLSRGTFQSVIDLAVCGAALAEAIAFSYKVRVAVAVETARSFGTNESNMSSARGIKCGSYTNTLHKQSKYWIRGTSERGTFAAFICTRMPEKQPLPDKLVNHSLSWIIPVCGSPRPPYSLDNKKWRDWGSSPTCVTTSRCYLQLKSLSGRQ